MKRKFMSALLIVAATCFTVSCEKDDKDNQSNTNSKFSGTIEQLASDAKTELGEGDIVMWNHNDVIIVNDGQHNGQRLYATLETPGTTTGFAFVGGEGTLGDGPYTAYYPASIYNGGTPTLPAVQQYTATANRIDNLPMYASSSSTTLQFHNICGVVELTLKGSKKVSSIDVSSESTALCGAFNVTNNAAVISVEPSAGNKKVTLDCGAGAQLDGTGIKFWVAIPAGIHQLTFRVNATDGSYSEFTTSRDVTVEANHIYAFERGPGFEKSVASGPFMGANGRTLYFAKGNLKYESNSYKFYDDQLASDEEDGIFQWNTVNDLTPSERTIEGHEWIVPTADDWSVIIGNQRTGSTVNGTSGCRYALATFGDTKGLLLCPDGKNITTINSLNVSWNTADAFSSAMPETVWNELKEAGFVFLPQYTRGGVFYYWTSSQVDDNNATAFQFGTTGCTNVPKSMRGEYFPVRMALVQ